MSNYLKHFLLVLNFHSKNQKKMKPYIYYTLSFFFLFNFMACNSGQEQNMEETVQLITELNQRLESGEEMSEEEAKEFASKILTQNGVSETKAKELANTLLQDGELSEEEAKELMGAILEGNGISNGLVKSIMTNAISMDTEFNSNNSDGQTQEEENDEQIDIQEGEEYYAFGNLTFNGQSYDKVNKNSSQIIISEEKVLLRLAVEGEYVINIAIPKEYSSSTFEINQTGEGETITVQCTQGNKVIILGEGTLNLKNLNTTTGKVSLSLSGTGLDAMAMAMGKTSKEEINISMDIQVAEIIDMIEGKTNRIVK